MAQRLGGAGELVFRLARLDHRAVERGERFGQQRMLAGDPVEPPRRRCASLPAPNPSPPTSAAVRRDRPTAARPSACRRAPRRGPPPRPPRAPARPVRRGGRAAGRGPPRPAPAAPAPPPAPSSAARHVAPGRFDPGDVGAWRKPIEQRPVAARIDQAAIVVLAVKFDQMPGQLAQQRDATGWSLTKALLAASRALTWRLRISGSPGSISTPASSSSARCARGSAANSKLAVTPALSSPARTSAAVGPVAQHQPQRIEQDRLARPGLAGQHAEPAAEIEVERLDQHDVADGKRGSACSPRSNRQGVSAGVSASICSANGGSSIDRVGQRHPVEHRRHFVAQQQHQPAQPAFGLGQAIGGNVRAHCGAAQGTSARLPRVSRMMSP